jgi:triphosphoribosyl-dephospho-CoA synthase
MPHRARTIGSLAQLACTWEVLARKAGNVCPGREFPDLTVADFLKSAAAIAPILDQAPTQPLGLTILRCIEATRKVVNTNTNLGIVVLLAPLASVPLDEPLQPGLARVLARTTVEDSRNVFAAIRLARPGGLGTAPEQDVRDEPTLPLRDVMALAMERDLIAAQYATDFDIVTAFAGSGLIQGVERYGNVEQAIVEMQLYLLFRNGDDLIRRKLGDQAGDYRMPAVKLLDVGLSSAPARRAFLDYDAFLRSDNHARNPGTTADMLAAMLFAALREGHISPETPFEWTDHPFQAAEPQA